VLLVFGAPRQLRLLAGQEHGRTIPLTEVVLNAAKLAHPFSSGLFLILMKPG